MRQVILFIAFALAVVTAHGQTVYRSVMPDGSIVFGDKPAPGAKESKPVVLQKPNIVAPVQRPPRAGATSQQPDLVTADADVRTAQTNLEQARAALEAGREPQPGERIGTAGGASRLTDAYQQRLKGLEDAVAAAQKQLDDAIARRNSAR